MRTSSELVLGMTIEEVIDIKNKFIKGERAKEFNHNGYTEWSCPNCGHEVGVSCKRILECYKNNYCSFCGTKIVY